MPIDLSPSPPPLPERVTPPTKDNTAQAAEAAAREEREKDKRRRGRASTDLTGGSVTAPVTARKVALGA